MRKIDKRITPGALVQVEGVTGWKEVKNIHESGNWITLKLWDGRFQMADIQQAMLNPTLPTDFMSFEDWLNRKEEIIYFN